MGPGEVNRPSPFWLRALAGIETGILGGAAMLVWLGVSSLVALRSAWIIPNLLGSAVRGRPVIDPGFGWSTISGLGIHLFVAGVAGMVFGLAIGESRNRLRVVLLGIVAGLLWYYGSQYLFWRKLGYLVVYYSPPRTLLFGHLIYGLVLGCFPYLLRSAGRRLSGENQEETVVTAAAPKAVE